ncbi:MAG TPA: hypothetical protein VMM76_14345 [Pirellulaceae bacterium]|nr:hypothetical protein [Pirellulaceae bacterium]
MIATLAATQRFAVLASPPWMQSGGTLWEKLCVLAVLALILAGVSALFESIRK